MRLEELEPRVAPSSLLSNMSSMAVTFAALLSGRDEEGVALPADADAGRMDFFEAFGDDVGSLFGRFSVLDGLASDSADHEGFSPVVPTQLDQGREWNGDLADSGLGYAQVPSGQAGELWTAWVRNWLGIEASATDLFSVAPGVDQFSAPELVFAAWDGAETVDLGRFEMLFPSVADDAPIEAHWDGQDGSLPMGWDGSRLEMPTRVLADVGLSQQSAYDVATDDLVTQYAGDESSVDEGASSEPRSYGRTVTAIPIEIIPRVVDPSEVADAAEEPSDATPPVTVAAIPIEIIPRVVDPSELTDSQDGDGETDPVSDTGQSLPLMESDLDGGSSEAQDSRRPNWAEAGEDGAEAPVVDASDAGQESVEAALPAEWARLSEPAPFRSDNGEALIHYVYHADGAEVLFTDRGIAVGLAGLDEPVEMRFAGAEATAPEWVEGSSPQHSPDGAMVYSDVYPGITLHVSASEGSLKSEFYVAPGADPSAIQVDMAGVERLSLDDGGNLVAETALGNLRDSAPYVYQMRDGERTPVAAEFTLVDQDTYGIGITGEYDAGQPLVIDPELTWRELAEMKVDQPDMAVSNVTAPATAQTRDQID
ncbi:MAG: hypothetical protein FJ279_34520, partial [Planctomycetes bacterium]|nr:hypothetical protein [Planctomycetota bacterium]